MSGGFLLITTLVLAVLAALSALFSAIETALFSLQPLQILRLKQRNPQLAASLERLMENPRRLLSAVLLGDATVNLPLIIIGFYAICKIAPSLNFWVVVLVIFVLVVFICDLVPKLLALALPYRVARIGGLVFNRLMPVLDPVCRLLQEWSETTANAIVPGKARPQHLLNDEELVTLAQLSADEGALHPAESGMIQEIIKLGGKTVKDCMTPRVDTFAIPDDLANGQAIVELKAKRRKRVPVYADTPDNILGVLDVGRFLLDPSVHYTEIMAPPSFVSETMKALDLLRSFLTHPQGLAVIVDEYGGTEGVITMADLIEEILGEAVPSAGQEIDIEDMGEGRLIVNGSARLDDLAELTGKRFNVDGIDTVAGLIFNNLGYVPKPGAYFQIGDLSFTVRRTSRKRVEEVLIVAHARKAGEQQEGGL